MANSNNNDDSRRDLTRIEDLSEFLHIEDNELDAKLGSFDSPSEEIIDDIDLNLPPLPIETIETEEGELNLNDFENKSPDDSDELQIQQDDDLIPMEREEDSNLEIDFTDSVNDDDNNFDSPFLPSEDSQSLSEEEIQTDNKDGPFSDMNLKDLPPQEKFEEVKTFAQQFSYGQFMGGGNPPFSLILRNLKYQEEASDILIILREMGIVTDENTSETEKSLELGSLLVPQISEYCAILLAHKLRRFDCDLEVGLSDEVHPKKQGEKNPRGLIKKENIRQNIMGSYQKIEDETPIKEILVSTTPTLEGFSIKKYVGVHTSFTIVDQEELERLKYVQQAIRREAPAEDYLPPEITPLSSKLAYNDYQHSFEVLFTDLCDQLKVKAIKEKANALLGLNYQLTALPFEKSQQGFNCYQLLCTATFAVVKPA